MIKTSKYISPIGELKLISKNNKLIGVHIIRKESSKNTNKIIQDNDEPILIKTKLWLDEYFKGNKPNINELEIELIGTPFQKVVWNILKEIPYGELTTYGNLSKKVAEVMNKQKMSAQAIGNAVKNNPVNIIIPCHRVIGKNGNLTGYNSGLDIKIKLIEHEKIDMIKLYY